MRSAGTWITNGVNHSSEGLKSMLQNSHTPLLHIACEVSSLAALKFAMESFQIHNFWWHTSGDFWICVCWLMIPLSM